MFFFFSAETAKQSLRQFEHEQNAQHNGDRHFQCQKAALSRLLQIVHYNIIGRPVDPRARHQRENPGDQKDGHRTALLYRAQTREEYHRDIGEKGGDGGGEPQKQHLIADPAAATDQPAQQIIALRHMKEQREGDGSHASCQKFPRNSFRHSTGPPK